jgi:hypothetical protein
VVWWIVGGVALGVLGIAVLALLTVRLWRQVRGLGRDVAAAGERLAAAADAIGRTDPRG